MNNKVWVKEAIARRGTVKVPFNFSYSPHARELLSSHIGGEDIQGYFDFPFRMTSPKSIKPLYASPDVYGPTIQDEFGVVWTTSKIDRGTPHICPIIEDSLKNYKFPEHDKPYRLDGIKKFCENNKEHFTAIWVGDLWERATFMRGMESLLLDVALNPKFVEELLDGIMEYNLKTMERLFLEAEFDCVAISDDYGTQKGLIISPDDWRRLIKPRLKKIYALAKKNGKTVFHHSCGNNYPIIGDLIELGLDILNPIQPEAMDVFKIKEEFGRDLCLCGGIRTQDLMPMGTPQEVRDEIKILKEKLGNGGGYILAPGITLQADVPLENLLAALDEAKK